jgi:hypothetical protein
MSALTGLPRAAWRAFRRFASLVHGYDDIRETYGDNPNGLSDEERLIARAVASNTASMPNGGGGW